MRTLRQGHRAYSEWHSSARAAHRDEQLPRTCCHEAQCGVCADDLQEQACTSVRNPPEGKAFGPRQHPGAVDLERVITKPYSAVACPDGLEVHTRAREEVRAPPTPGLL